MSEFKTLPANRCDWWRGLSAIVGALTGEIPQPARGPVTADDLIKCDEFMAANNAYRALAILAPHGYWAVFVGCWPAWVDRAKCSPDSIVAALASAKGKLNV